MEYFDIQIGILYPLVLKRHLKIQLKQISLEFLKSIGDWIETGNTLVIVSETNNTEKIEKEDIEFSFTDNDSLQDNKIQKENNRMKYKKNIISDFQIKFFHPLI